MLRHIPALIGLGILVWYFLHTRKAPSSYHNSVANTLSFATAIVLFAISYIRESLPALVSPDYVAQNRPYLDTTLIVDSISSNQIQFHYEVKNIGKLPAAGLSFATRNSGYAGFDGFKKDFTNLAPGASIVVYKGIEGRIPMPTTNIFWNSTLYCMYFAEIDGRQIHYRDDFRFRVDPNYVTIGNSGWENCIRNEGTLSIEQQYELLGLSTALDNDVGSFMVWFNVESNVMPGALAKSATKLLVYDPTSTSLVYSTFAQSNIQAIFSYQLPATTDWWHHAAITWDRDGGTLYHNGEPALKFQFSTNSANEITQQAVPEYDAQGASSPEP